MKSFIQFLYEAPTNPGKPGNVFYAGFGTVGGDLLSSSSTNVINVPQSKATSGSMGFNIDPFTANKFNNELLSTGRSPSEYNSTYSAITDLRSDNNNQENQQVQFRMLQSMFDQLPQGSGMNGSQAMGIANELSVNGFKVDEIYQAMIKMYQDFSKSQGLNINPYQALNNLITSKQQAEKGIKQQKPNVNTFDPLADLKKHKLFAPIDPEDVIGDDVGEGEFQGGFEGTGTDVIYGS
jgi:hypothetical protein